MTHNFMVWSAECSCLRSEGFSCTLEVLNGGLEINKLQFFDVFDVQFHNFWSPRPLDPDPELDPHRPKMLDTNPH
jgi:hypothetical protein